MKKIGVFGIDFIAEEKGSVIKRIISSDERTTISSLSMPLVIEMRRAAEFRKALIRSDIVLPDGMGIVWASRLIHGKNGLKKRIAGPDFFFSSLQMAQEKNMGCFFLGSSIRVLNRISDRLKKEFPEIKLKGTLSPPFGEWSDEENKRIVDMINECKPDILWVGMTAPKQEVWVSRNRDVLNVKIVASVGAAFDFFAGTQKRAPEWMQKKGLEWLHRTIKEPYRMGKRYLKGIPYFLYIILSEIFNKNR